MLDLKQIQIQTRSFKPTKIQNKLIIKKFKPNTCKIQSVYNEKEKII